MTFHAVSARARDLVCDECSCIVDPTDQGRTDHQRWHDAQRVIDLTTTNDAERLTA